MTSVSTDLFKGRHFDQDVIVLCVRWYLSYKLSSHDLVDMMNERGIALAHTTILRWVGRSRSAGRTSIVQVDKQGRTVNFLLTARRDVAAAKRFFQKATNGNGTPRVITLDAYAASHRAIRELKAEGKMPKRESVPRLALNDSTRRGHDQEIELAAKIRKASTYARC